MTNQTSRTAFTDRRGGHLVIDGADVTELAARYGTPFFLFSERRIKQNTWRFREAAESVHPKIRICYASKANSNLAVLGAIRDAGGDIEVNSGGELFKACKVGFKPHQIVFNGVSKTDDELEHAIDYGILAINIDSLFELDRVAAVARRIGKRANVAIRLVPEIVTRSHIGLQTGLLSSKFGISPVQLDTAIDVALSSPDALNLAGIHVHIGSQTPDARPYVTAFAELWRLISDVYQRTGHRFSHINLGGGLPVNYLQDTPESLPIGARERDMLSAELSLGEVLKTALDEALSASADTDGRLQDLTIILEPGRRLVGDAGLLVTTVCNIKERPETEETWLLTDAGYSLAISMAMYKWYYHLVSASRASEPHSAPFKVAGPLCDSGDVYFDLEKGGRLPAYRMLPEDTQPGDVLALLNTGAYAMDQASQYNGRPRPPALMVRESGEVTLVRRGESYDDLCAFDVW